MKRIIVCLLIGVLFVGSSVPVAAQDTSVYSTNIGDLNSFISHGSGYLQGSMVGSFTGSDCHAIYECSLEYKASTGVWTTASNVHVVRSYDPGRITMVTDNFYGLSVGTQYRYHVYMRVIGSSGYIVDADVVNSSAITYVG